METKLVVLLLAVFGSVCNGEELQEDSIYQVPVQYVSEKHIYGEAYDINHFTAHLCGGCLFDKKMAIVSLVLQKEAWNQTTNDILKANVTTTMGHFIEGNLKTGKYVETFNFTYYSSYSDLSIKVQNGAGSGMIYTLSLKFDSAVKTDSYCENRYLMSPFEAHAYRKYQIQHGASLEQLHELMPIFKMSTPYSVRSHDLKFLQLDYCFPHSSHYKITVTVVAEDDSSAFATYVCPKSIKKCNPGDAPFHDTSGSAVNMVDVKILSAADIGPIRVVVRGDGRVGKMNTFTLAASKYSALN